MLTTLPARRAALAAAAVLTAGLALAPAARATFPGGNGRIVYLDAARSQLFTADPSGAAPPQVTELPDGAGVGEPAWSPDSRRIAFSTDVSGEQRLWVMDADGGHAGMVFDDLPVYRDRWPRYTPDGQTLVFGRCLPGDAPCSIWRVGVDGRGLRAITPFQVGRREATDFFADVYPDGTRIAFTRFGARGITAQVMVAPIDGANPHAIT